MTGCAFFDPDVLRLFERILCSLDACDSLVGFTPGAARRKLHSLLKKFHLERALIRGRWESSKTAPIVPATCLCRTVGF